MLFFDCGQLRTEKQRGAQQAPQRELRAAFYIANPGNTHTQHICVQQKETQHSPARRAT